MKTCLRSLFVLGVFVIAASQASAQLPAQPYVIPAVGDYGVFSLRDQAIGASDPDLAKAYDNFSLSTAYNLNGISWAGVYAEPMPGALSDTDFIVEIFGESSGTGLADVTSGPLLTFTFEGGPAAGFGGADLSVTPLGHVSPSTPNAIGGGPAYGYNATLPSTLLAAGDYWIAISADQRFDNATPVVDPEWMWHLGSGPGDGFATYDRTLDPSSMPLSGSLEPGKDLAFTLRGAIVPEPSAFASALVGLLAIGFVRRKR